jgi:hypothetical protein
MMMVMMCSGKAVRENINMGKELSRLRRVVYAARLCVAWDIHLRFDGKCVRNILLWKYKCIDAMW